MKRLFYQTRMYDFTTKEEAERHIKEMTSKGWKVKQDIYNNGCDVFSWTVEYLKEC